MDKVVYELNSAPLEELIALPGMTPELAEKIRSGRPYGTVDDLKQVKGVSSKMLKEWRSQLRVNGYHEASPTETMPETAPEAVEPPKTMEAAAVPAVETSFALQPEPGIAAVSSLPVTDVLPESAPDEIPAPALEENAMPVQSPIEQAVITPPAEPVQTSAAVASPPAVEPKKAAYITRTQAALLVFFSSFITLLVAVGVTLGIFLLLNGGLTYASQAAFQRLDGQVSAVTTQAGELERELSGVQERLAVVDALSAQVTGMETEMNGLERDVEAAAQAVARMTSQLTQLDSEVNALAERTDAFDAFLIGLQQLLEGLPAPQK